MRELGPMPPSIGATWPRIVSGEDVVNIADLMHTDVYRSRHERTLRSADIGGMRSLLSVALRTEGALLGALSVYRQEVRLFSDNDVATLTTLLPLLLDNRLLGFVPLVL
jgi:GAF domain-containing protein